MSDPFLGEIKMFAGSYAPVGWAFCNGQLLAKKEHRALFDVLETYYGGDGVNNFRLPDLRGRVPIHAGQGDGLSNKQLGERDGVENITLTEKQMPAHQHSITSGGSSGNATADLKVYEGEGNTDKPAAAKSIASEIVLGSRSFKLLSTEIVDTAVKDAVSNIKSGGVPNNTQNSGAGQSFDIRQPYTVINFIICLDGVFPSRA